MHHPSSSSSSIADSNLGASPPRERAAGADRLSPSVSGARVYRAQPRRDKPEQLAPSACGRANWPRPERPFCLISGRTGGATDAPDDRLSPETTQSHAIHRPEHRLSWAQVHEQQFRCATFVGYCVIFDSRRPRVVAKTLAHYLLADLTTPVNSVGPDRNRDADTHN